MKKTLIKILSRYEAYTIVESVTEEEWNEILKEQYAKAEKTEDGLFIENPLFLEIEEIYADIKNEKEFIDYVNQIIEEYDSLVWDIKEN